MLSRSPLVLITPVFLICHEINAYLFQLIFALFVSMDCVTRICVNTLPIPRKWDEVRFRRLQMLRFRICLQNYPLIALRKLAHGDSNVN